MKKSVFLLFCLFTMFKLQAQTTPPTLVPAANATVDANFTISFTDNAAWRTAITSIRSNDSLLQTYSYTVGIGTITFIPSTTNKLQLAKIDSIVIQATGYANAVIKQTVGAGVAKKLAIKTQPTAPSINGANFATQPVVLIQDQYGNTTTSTATVIAYVSLGSWVITGDTSKVASNGMATYSTLKATNTAQVNSAVIGFKSSGLTSVLSNSFILPAATPTTFYTTNGADISSVSNWWSNTNGSGTNPANFTTSGNTFIVQSGQTCSVNSNVAFGSGVSLQVNGTIIPGATVVISGSGTLTGTGTVQVTRTASPANLISQYSITTKTLTNLTVEYASLTGGQAISNTTYKNLKLDNTSGLNLVEGPFVVNGTFTTSAGGILDLGNNTLTGTLTSVVNNGTIKTLVGANGTAFPSGKTWGGTVEYTALTGSQTIVSGTYNNLTLDNTSGINNAQGLITVNGTLTTNGNGIFNLGNNRLAGTLSGISNSGVIKVSLQSTSLLPSGKTWGGLVEYSSTFGGQTIVDGTYNNITIDNISGTDTVTNNISINGRLTTTSGGNLLVNCGVTIGFGNNASFTNAGIITGPTTAGNRWARIVNASPITNTGTIGASSSYIAVSSTISGGTVGSNVLQNSSQAAVCPSTPPALTFDTTPTVDAAYNIKFTDDATWRNAITSITINGLTIPTIAYTSTIAGRVTFTPSASTLLQKSGYNYMVISANGYFDKTFYLSINPGVATKLKVQMQPTSPAFNGGKLVTQPSVIICDQYGNKTTSSATITATVGSSSWTIGGTVSKAASIGQATFTSITSFKTGGLDGATITFTCGNLTPATSETFAIPASTSPYYYSANGTDITDINNWWSNSDGTGSHPLNLTTSGTIFTVQTGHTCTIDRKLSIDSLVVNGTIIPKDTVVISGGGILGTGTIVVTRAVASEDNLANQYPYYTDLTNLTVDYAGTSPQTINTFRYNYNSIKINNNVTITANASGSRTKSLIIASGKTLSIGIYSLYVGNTIINNGAVTGSGTIYQGLIIMSGNSSSYTVSGKGSYYNFEFNHNSATYPVATIQNDMTIAGTFNNDSITVNINCGVTISAANAKNTGGSIVGPTATGSFARIINNTAFTNTGTIGANTSNIAFSGTITNSGKGTTGKNVLQSSSQLATCGSVSTTWNGTGTWSTTTNWNNATVPTGGSIVVESGELIVNQNISVTDLTIQPNAKLTLQAGNSITVLGNFSIFSDSTGTGSFVDNGGTNSINGTTSLQQYIKSGRNWYIASPVTSAKSAVAKTVQTNKLWYNDEPTQTWNEIADATTPLSVMKGYVTNQTNSGVVTFTGAMNTGYQSTTLSNSSKLTNSGFNLVGNPYPSSVNWESAIKTNLSPSLWYRTKNKQNVYVFDTYNANVHLGTNNNGNGSVTQIIPPMQAVWVRVDTTKTSGSLSFDNSMRCHQINNTLKSDNEITNIRLNVSNGKNSDESIIVFNEQANNGFDSFDSEKMFGSSNDLPEIFTLADNKKLVINGLKSIDTLKEIPLGFKTSKAGTFTISASEIAGLENVPVILEDKFLHKTQDLSLAPTYSFTSDSVNDANRFTIRLKADVGPYSQSLSNLADSVLNASKIEGGNISIYKSNGQLHIYITNGSIETVTVFDILGQAIFNEKGTGAKISFDVPSVSGTYFIKIETNRFVVTKKIVIE